LSYALQAFAASSLIDQVVLVVAVEEEGSAYSLVEGLSKEVKIVHGGRRRQDSAFAGIQAAAGEIVLIHDAARPFPSLPLIHRVIRGAQEYGACVPVIPVVDTLRYRGENGLLLPTTVDRERLLQIQTPQGFQRSVLDRCLRETLTIPCSDDAAAVLTCGVPVWTVAGELTNMKVTTKEDLRVAETLATALVH
jgi:2-C-methyl-D-erythritol 4-phosphate cytidylyltransferase